MQNDKIYSSVVSHVKSRQDLDKIIGDLNNLETAIYKLDQAGRDRAFSVFSEDVVSYFKSVPEGQLDNVLREIKEKIANTPTIKIKVAFKPSPKFIKELGNVVGGSIIEVDYDPSIPGGAVLEKDGKYIDLTIKV